MAESISYQILIKAPKSTRFISIDSQNNSQWTPHENINIHLKELLNMTIYPHGHIYNDQVTSSRISSTKAHAKGVLLWNDAEIMWLIHSVPKWPLSISSTSLPDSGILYGQSFIELKFPINHLESILNHLSIMNVNIYFSMLTNNRPQENVNTLILDEYSLSETISHVAKSRKWKHDLYDDFLVPLFGGGEMNIECWMRPTGKDTLHGNNVEIIRWPDGTTYNETRDHSKFGVSKFGAFVYMGDLNHQASQAKRGGGGIIIKNAMVWNRMRELIHKE